MRLKTTSSLLPIVVSWALTATDAKASTYTTPTNFDKLTISGGTTATHAALAIGTGELSIDSLTVDGKGSSLKIVDNGHTPPNLVVGGKGKKKGTLTDTNSGGDVHVDGDLDLGNSVNKQPTSVGQVNVSNNATLEASNIHLGAFTSGTTDVNTGVGILNVNHSTVTVGDATKNADDGIYNEANGTVIIDGGSSINLDSSKLDILSKRGDQSTSSLQIGAGGSGLASVSLKDNSVLDVDGFIYLGAYQSSGGKVSLSAEDSTIIGGLFDGYGAHGSADVSLVNSSYNDNGEGFYVGMPGGNSATYTQKAGSFNATGAVVGYASEGTATFDNVKNATVGANGVLLGYEAGTSGTLNLTNNSTLNASIPGSGVIVGDYGQGNLNISGDSTLTTAGLALGYDGGVGNVSIDSSTLNMSDSISVGASGKGGSGLMSFKDSTFNILVSNFTDSADTAFIGTNTLNTNTNTAVMSGLLSGSGGFNKTGTGILEIDNTANNYTGLTKISAGTLQGTGRIGGDLDVLSGATLRGGYATKPAVNQYGTMTVAGNTTMESGSTLTADLGKFPTSTLVDDKKSFTIQNGAKLDLNIADGAHLTVGQEYNIVKADGGVSGTAFKVDGNALSKLGDTKDSNGYALLQAKTNSQGAEVLYGKNDIYVGIERNGAGGATSPTPIAPNFGVGALTRNEQASGYGLDALSNAGKDEGILNSIAGIDNAQRIQALDTLSGQINADQKTAMVNDAYYIRDMLIKRMDCLFSETRRRMNDKDGSKGAGACTFDPHHKISTWGAMFGSRGNSSGYKGWDSATSLGQSSAGWIMGADTAVGRWRVGGTIAYGRDWFSAAGDQTSHAHSNNVTLGGYSGTSWRVGGINQDARITLKTGATYTWDVIHSDRDVNFNSYSAHNSSNNLGGTAQAFAETGYKFNAGNWEIEPFTRMTYMNYNHGSYHEHGSNSALDVKGRNSSMGYSTTGVKLATVWSVGKVSLSPHAQLAYRYGFGSLHSVAHERFAALGNGGAYNMNTIGTPLAKNTALTDLGFTMGMTDHVSMSFDYIGQYGRHETSSGGSGSLKLNF